MLTVQLREQFRRGHFSESKRAGQIALGETSRTVPYAAKTTVQTFEPVKLRGRRLPLVLKFILALWMLIVSVVGFSFAAWGGLMGIVWGILVPFSPGDPTTIQLVIIGLAVAGGTISAIYVTLFAFREGWLDYWPPGGGLACR